MPASDLYKIGRLVNTETFMVRVGAAMVLHAQGLVNNPASNARNLAIGTLLKPMIPEISMIALVASDAVVLSQVGLDGDVAGLDGLTDAEVKRVVAAKWAIVAAKYPTDPTPVA